MASWSRILIMLGSLAAAFPARALEPATTGIVLLHGKWGMPGQMTSMVSPLKEAGFLVEAPEMPWSGQRLFDRSYDDAMTEIDAAAGRLRANGAARVVVVGQSLGANAALGYAARGRALAAVVVIAPGHYPEGRVFLDKAADSVAKARAMVAAGQGGETASFISLNDGDRNRPIQAKAGDYLSYYGPDGAGAMSLFAAAVGAAPILWVAPKFDTLSEIFPKMVQAKLPSQVPFTKLAVNAHHGDAPQVGASGVVAWLKELP